LGATLDTAAALANGFSNSPVLFLSHAGTGGSNGIWLQDVWTKGWTEVTFDLSPYRGQQVSLTFESDNCTPGAHFAYAYVALRNTCAGLEISGNPIACANTPIIYSVPSLAGAIYNWTVPAGWTINSGANSNIINVTPGASNGMITVHEVNGCADLKDTLDVTVSPPTIPGAVNGSNRVCSGPNSTLLTANGQVGNIINWISSIDGINWVTIPNTTNTYTAQNLTTTTQYRVLVQNGVACRVDTSSAATIVVDPKSVGGILNPANSNVCANQTSFSVFTLTGNTGTIVNWQFSNDNTNWNNFLPIKTDPVYYVNLLTANTQYRTIVKSGVCPADTSSIARINFINVPFPQATIDPDFSTICYGRSTPLNANITIGTSYSWSNASTLTNQGNGSISSLPFAINAIATPRRTTDYVLTINNAGCPNPLNDTFHVLVAPRIIVFAGNDTSIVSNQPLQLHATSSDSTANIFNWSPATGLNFTNIYNPVATLSMESGETFMYIVRATNADGCYGEDNIIVTVFKTGPQIFVPSAFSPNGDGLNDIVFPICVGIKQLNYFRIFNRWGQMVFSTNQIGKGWNGLINGTKQGTANFVYMAQAVDYLGHVIFKKGNIVLIR
jgi:gliding motility-associated-like protein